jgi:hypothetical protein
MHLILGGAYQGKTGYAKERFGLSDAISTSAAGRKSPRPRGPVSHLERFTRACVEARARPVVERGGARPAGGGPCFATTSSAASCRSTRWKRLWREQTGRFLTPRWPRRRRR